MGVREIERFLEQWQMEVNDLLQRMILAPTPRERAYAILLLAQGWTVSATADALERDPRTIGRWASACPNGTGGQQQRRNLCRLPGPVEAEALRTAERNLGQRIGARRRGNICGRLVWRCDW